MADIISIATATPEYCHQQKDILSFMQNIYGLDEVEKRKLSFLYKQSGIHQRYSVIADYGLPQGEWTFIPALNQSSFPSVETRMKIYNTEALKLAVKAFNNCIQSIINKEKITHLITVSCTGMSAPGLDLQLLEALNLSPDIFRTSINFMGCYAAIHALKLAKFICDSTPQSNVIIVDVELCTLHFQKEYTLDNAASSLLFADGAAAVLVSNYIKSTSAIKLNNFFGHVALKGKKDMAWEISSQGFLMTLSGYIPELIKEDIQALVKKALAHAKLSFEEIEHWCIHPGGKKILDTIESQLQLAADSLQPSRQVLFNYGNMSSPTILFVLKEMMDNKTLTGNIFGVAFGPGLTMETFTAFR